MGESEKICQKGRGEKMFTKIQQRKIMQLPVKTSKKPAGPLTSWGPHGAKGRGQEHNSREGTSSHAAQPQEPHAETRTAPEHCPGGGSPPPRLTTVPPAVCCVRWVH